ncbi:hypothetical protein, partial [Faecalibaculum rodentium]|uniref:hypothetical protein n=1 Tax=Faecalibaculum rodentium TaxID=1702221 RepID=UPI0025ADF5BC
MVGIEIKTDRSLKRGSAPSFRFWQMKIELDIMPLLPPQDPDTDRLLRWLGSFKAVKCLIEQFKSRCMGDFYRTGDDLVLSFFRLKHR